MVRLINEKNIWILQKVLLAYMKFQESRTHIVGINQKNYRPCIYAMWHSDQFCVYGLQDKAKVNILISTSFDGEIISYAAKGIGFSTVRGSSGKKGAVESSMQMLEKLNNGEVVAIMVDGPGGPYHTVKNGVIKLARMSGVPIVPVCWYSEDKTFHTIPTWDKMTFPVGNARIVNLYGEPIYIPKDLPDEQIAEKKKLIKDTLEDLQQKVPGIYREALENKLWEKQKI